MKRIAWWIQMVESSPLAAHQSMFTIFDEWYSMQLEESAKSISNWIWDSCVPDLVLLQGFGPPPDFQLLADKLQMMMNDGEYMVFAQMVDSVIKRDAITYYIITNKVTATMDGRAYFRDALEKIWEFELDRSESLP